MLKGLDVFHAGTQSDGAHFVGNGGRVLLAATKAKTLEEAKTQVYEKLNIAEWNGFFYRTDIGWRAFEGK